MASSGYFCRSCDERPRSRADWLVHMMLHRHSLRAREDLKLWLKDMRQSGDILVISGLELIDNSMLLELLSAKLQSFVNIVFFKPQADICLIVCNRREFAAFMTKPLPKGFSDLKYQLYKDVGREEWARFFKKTNAYNTPSTLPTTSNNYAAVKRKLTDDADACPPKVYRLQDVSIAKDQGYLIPPPTPNSMASDPTARRHSSTSSNESEDRPVPPQVHRIYFERGNASAPGANEPKDCDNLDAEIEKIFHVVMLPMQVRQARRRLLISLKDTFRTIPAFVKCELIPVGADFLGFNLESEYYTVYFDGKGTTDPSNAGSSCVISELQGDMDRMRTPVHNILKGLEKEGKLTDLKCEGADKIRFRHTLYGVKCRILLKSFMMAQTARLCRQLISMDEQAPYLLVLVTFWGMKHSGFNARGSTNPFIFNWLIYFFLMIKGTLTPAIDLHNRRTFDIIDRGMNVAFAYDEKAGADDFERHVLKKGQSYSMIETLLEWFIFMDDTFRETNTKGINQRHSLMCPRYGELIDKRKFKVCGEHFDSRSTKYKTSAQKKVRKYWRNDLISIGFDETSWGALKDLKLPETLSIQHPLYISENIGLYFNAPFSQFFFGVVQKTRGKLTDLITESENVPGLINALS